jgi:hypothetical protein
MRLDANPKFSNFLAEIRGFGAKITRPIFTPFGPFRSPKYDITAGDHGIKRFQRLVKAIPGWGRDGNFAFGWII